MKTGIAWTMNSPCPFPDRRIPNRNANHHTRTGRRTFRNAEPRERLARPSLPPFALPVFLAASLSLLPFNSISESLLLTGATVHPISDPALSPGQVWIRDGKIIAVGQSVDAPGATILNLTNQHLYPGLIDASTPLGLLEISAVRSTRDFDEVGDYTPDVESWVAVNPDSELLPVARANGITHILPVPMGGIVSGQSGLVALDGWTTEDMTVKKPVALHLFWPDMDLDLRPKDEWKDPSKWKSSEDQAKERARKLLSLEEFFAEAKAYARARGARQAGFETIPAWEAMLPFVHGDIPVMIHADDLRQITAAVRWASTNGYRMILAGGRDAVQARELLATNHVPVIFDHMFSLPDQDSVSYDVYFTTPARLHEAGVKVIFGLGLGGFAASMARNLPYQAAQAMAYGLPEEEALKGLTLYPAQILGVADRLGSLAPGQEASLMAATGPILDIRSTITHVWIAGNETSLETRHTRLYEKYKNRPRGVGVENGK